MNRRRLLLVALLPAVSLGLPLLLGQPRPPREGDSAPLPAPAVKIEVRDGYRFITSNGIPDHEPGAFPNRHNPNSISAQKYALRVPVEPKPNDRPTPARRGGLFGVAVNGVVFDPGTAEAWKDDPSSGWNIEALTGPMDLGLDKSNAHVQPNGAYHYHSIPTGLIEKLAGKTPDKPVLVGWAGDGFPLYSPLGYTDAKDPRSPLKKIRPSYRLKPGTRPAQPEGPGGKFDGSYTQDWEYAAGMGDLDECNGRTGVTPEFPDGTYYYVLTGQFPFVPRLYRGTPDESFLRKGPGGPPRRRPGGPDGRPPPPPRER